MPREVPTQAYRASRKGLHASLCEAEFLKHIVHLTLLEIMVKIMEEAGVHDIES